jgi:DNA-directed RNA polymerase, sigma subunit (sigma70/sigma32)
MDRFLTDEIEGALTTLQPRDAKVLRLYFGLDGGREHTLEEIGGMLGVTRERVRQLRDRALKRLREGDVGGRWPVSRHSDQPSAVSHQTKP